MGQLEGGPSGLDLEFNAQAPVRLVGLADSVQTAILVFTCFVRPNSGALAFLAVLAAALGLWISRHSPAFAGLLGKVGVSAAAAIFVVIVVLGSIPDEYGKRHQIFGTFWHRILASLNVHPDFPFSKLREEYDCTWSEYFRVGFKKEGANQFDWNAQCIWVSDSRDKSAKEIVDGVFGPAYESSMRHAVFRAAILHPREMLSTYLYYKPALIQRVLWRALDLQFRAAKQWVMMLSILQLVLLTFFLVVGSALRLVNGRIVLLHLVFLGALTIAIMPQYLIGWAQFHLAADLIFVEFSACLLMFAFVLTGIVHTVRARIHLGRPC